MRAEHVKSETTHMQKDEMIHVLFLSRDNDPRAQLATGLLNHLGKGSFIATHTPESFTQLDTRVQAVLGEININQQAAIEGNNVPHFDYIINICDHSSASCLVADPECPKIPDSQISGCWGYSNPLCAETEEDRMQSMRRVRDEIANRLCIWMPAALHAKKQSNRSK